jgi:hypothetical protein
MPNGRSSGQSHSLPYGVEAVGEDSIFRDWKITTFKKV